LRFLFPSFSDRSFAQRAQFEAACFFDAPGPKAVASLSSSLFFGCAQASADGLSWFCPSGRLRFFWYLPIEWRLLPRLDSLMHTNHAVFFVGSDVRLLVLGFGLLVDEAG
jgi:hypothetical protein